MNKYSTDISDVLIIEPYIHSDERGFFAETWRREWFDDITDVGEFVQDNHSKSKQGVLRGLHYQIKKTQGKYIRVIVGEIFDVAVDMRKSSPTFGKWVGVILSAENKKSLWVPPGFAHGFYVISQEAEIIYKCTNYYSAENERILLWNDPNIGVTWPIMKNKIIVSERDRTGQKFLDCEIFS